MHNYTNEELAEQAFSLSRFAWDYSYPEVSAQHLANELIRRAEQAAQWGTFFASDWQPD